jgi:hypothetical protein
MNTAYFRELYKRDDGTYLIDISGWKKRPNSVYYTAGPGDDYRVLPPAKNILQNKIEKERKKAEEKVANARNKLEAANKAYQKITPYTSKFIPAKDRVTKAEKELKKAEEGLQIFLIPVAPVAAKRGTIRGLIRGKMGLKASLARARGRISARKEQEEAIAAFTQRGVAKRALKRGTTGLKASLARARGRISARNAEKSSTTAAQKKAARKQAAENRKLERLMALQEEVEQEFPDVRNDSERWAVELSHKLHPKSKTTLQGRNYWREEGYKGCAADITDERYAYLCDKLNKPKPRKRAAAGLSGAGTNMVNLPEYRRAINSLRN